MNRPRTSDLAARHARVRPALDTLSLDALVVTSAANIRYLTNHAGSAGILVMTREAAHLLVDFRYRESVRMLQESESACPGLVIRDVPASYDEALLTCLSEIGVSTVGFEAEHVTVAKHDWWLKTAEARTLGITFRATDKVIEHVRQVKDAFERTTLRDARAA
jgi:Xaa-Pro aminopeptidase